MAGAKLALKAPGLAGDTGTGCLYADNTRRDGFLGVHLLRPLWGENFHGVIFLREWKHFVDFQIWDSY